MSIVLAWTSVARAAIDLTNRWFVTIDETQPGGSNVDHCDVELVQIGENVSTPSPGVCNLATLELEGTVDAQSGALAWQGTYTTLFGPPLVREFTFTGTAAASGWTFTGGRDLRPRFEPMTVDTCDAAGECTPGGRSPCCGGRRARPRCAATAAIPARARRRCASRQRTRGALTCCRSRCPVRPRSTSATSAIHS